MADMNIVDKNILAVINKNKSQQNSVPLPKAKAPRAPKKMITDRVKDVVTIPKKNKPKTVVKKIAPKDTSTKHVKESIKHVKESIKHVKELKKSVQSLSGQMRKKETSVQKQLQEHKQHLIQMGQDVAETKMHYQHIPKLSMETQMLIESMGKLSAVVKQLLVLFNQKISNEEGPLFERLDGIAEQNEQIAQALLAVADLVKEKQIPKAEIKQFNPYMPQRSMPMQVREQMPSPQQMPNIPQDLGKFQFPGAEQDSQQQGIMQQSQEMQTQEQPQMKQLIPQFGAPLPLFSEAPQSQQQEPAQNRKRMLF